MSPVLSEKTVHHFRTLRLKVVNETFPLQVEQLSEKEKTLVRERERIQRVQKEQRARADSEKEKIDPQSWWFSPHPVLPTFQHLPKQ